MGMKVGTKLKTRFGMDVTVLKLLGEGGQGYVYEVDYAGERKAMKWYKTKALGSNPPAFLKNLKRNIDRGAPAPQFLWPLDLVLPYEGSFGYIMDLKKPECCEVYQFLLCQVRFASIKIAVEACLQIVSAYRILHNAGYTYRDINEGNFFIDPVTGNVQICDNDNAAPNDFDTGVVGRPRYMAPEVVMGQMPNTQSDLYSMAQVIYMLLCLNHPLEGSRYLVAALTREKQNLLYGSEALFIMDPEDNRNGPHPQVHRNTIVFWNCLPEYMKAIFLQAFSRRSLRECPSARPIEIEWLQALTRFRSDITRCRCGNDIFLSDGKPMLCDACGTMPVIPNRLVMREYCLPAIGETRIYRCQLGSCNADRALDLMAIVGQKRGTNICGIRNKSGVAWDVVKANGENIVLAPEQVLLVEPGVRFRIEDEVIRIEKNI